MARSANETAEKLIEIYKGNKKRFRLSDEAFKKVAGKTRLRSAFVKEVDSALREDGYVIVDLRQEADLLVIINQRVLKKYEDLSEAMEDHAFVDEEWDEE